jgi:outer membrane protein TolC
MAPLFAGQEELSLPQLLAEVEARNPSVQAMAYAWRAMAQRYPQAVSLDDPMFMTMVAPASFNSSTVQPAYILSGSQKLPWFGKRETRGQAARSEADAAFHDLRDTRLQVAQVTRIAFYDYYLVEREAELVGQNSRVMQEFRDSAQVKYENNQVTQQDVLQADVELADIERRQLEIERMRRVAIARINTLLRRTPGEPLPPPPRALALEAAPPPADALQQLAATGRPDLAALAARVRAEEAAVDLAIKQYYPDAEFFGRYDSFWQPASTQSDLRAQVGMNMNVPIYRKKLQAAVCEAQFRLSQRRAEYQQRLLDVQYDVQSAYEQVQESRQAAQLYTQKYLPLAEQNLAAARSNYDFGKINFLSLAQAQRQLIEVREKYQQTLTDSHRRLADLERAVGSGMSKPEEVEEMP